MDILFGRTHPNAPAFWSVTFVVGCWGMLFGSLYAFEVMTRGLRQQGYDAPKSPDFLARWGFVERTKAERFSERTFSLLGSFGRKCFLGGAPIAAVGALGAMLRQSVFPYWESF